MAVFKAAEVTANPVYEIDQLIADEHIQQRGVIVEAPDEEAGSVLMHNVIPRLSATPGKLRQPAPRLGQHTRDLSEQRFVFCDFEGQPLRCWILLQRSHLVPQGAPRSVLRDAA